MPLKTFEPSESRFAMACNDIEDEDYDLDYEDNSDEDSYLDSE